MKVLGMLVCVAVFSIITALIETLMLSKLWAWFVSAEYGSGPSYGAWFGISMILGLIVNTSMPRRSSTNKDDDDLDDIVKKVLSRQIELWFGCGMSLIIAWLTGSAMGWIH